MKIGDMDLCDLLRQLRAEFFAKDGDITVQAGRSIYISGGGEIAVPVGGIILWSGSVASIPTGWALCDGSSGTPDLTDRFVIGAGDTYNPGDTGGSTSHSHDDGTLTTDSDSHSHSFSDTSSTPSATATLNISGGFGCGTDYHTHSVSGTTGGDSHSHSVTGGNTGSTSTLPSYYALAYIMRTT